MKPSTSQLLLSVIVLVGCGEQSSSPVPQPVPGLIRQSTPTAGALKTLVVGLPGAVAGKGKVHIREGVGGKIKIVDTTDSGSFVVALPIAEGDSLEAAFETDDGLSAMVPITPRSLGVTPSLGQPKPGVVQAPHDGKPEVVVTNDAGAGQPLLLDATPDVDVVVSNIDNGEVVTTVTDKDGKFSTKIGATTGHTIQIMLVTREEPPVTSDFVSITVP